MNGCQQGITKIFSFLSHTKNKSKNIFVLIHYRGLQLQLTNTTPTRMEEGKTKMIGQQQNNFRSVCLFHIHLPLKIPFEIEGSPFFPTRAVAVAKL